MATFIFDLLKHTTSSASQEAAMDIHDPSNETNTPKSTKMSFFEYHEYVRSREKRSGVSRDMNARNGASYDYEYTAKFPQTLYAKTFVKNPMAYCHLKMPCHVKFHPLSSGDSGSFSSEGGNSYGAPHLSLSEPSQVRDGHLSTSRPSIQRDPLLPEPSPKPSLVSKENRRYGSTPNNHKFHDDDFYNCQQSFYENFKYQHQKILDRLNCSIEDIPIDESQDYHQEEKVPICGIVGHWVSSSCCHLDEAVVVATSPKENLSDDARNQYHLETTLLEQLKDVRVQKKLMEDHMNEIAMRNSEERVLETDLHENQFDMMENDDIMDLPDRTDVKESSSMAVATKPQFKPDRTPLLIETKVRDDCESIDSRSTPGSSKMKVVMFKFNKPSEDDNKTYRLLKVIMNHPGTLGLEIEQENNDAMSVRVVRVIPGSQGDEAGVRGGDILCHPDSDVEFSHREFLRLVQSSMRPLSFNVKRTGVLSGEGCKLELKECNEQKLADGDKVQINETEDKLNEDASIKHSNSRVDTDNMQQEETHTEDVAKTVSDSVEFDDGEKSETLENKDPTRHKDTQTQAVAKTVSEIIVTADDVEHCKPSVDEDCMQQKETADIAKTVSDFGEFDDAECSETLGNGVNVNMHQEISHAKDVAKNVAKTVSEIVVAVDEVEHSNTLENQSNVHQNEIETKDDAKPMSDFLTEDDTMEIAITNEDASEGELASGIPHVDVDNKSLMKLGKCDVKKTRQVDIEQVIEDCSSEDRTINADNCDKPAVEDLAVDQAANVGKPKPILDESLLSNCTKTITKSESTSKITPEELLSALKTLDDLGYIGNETDINAKAPLTKKATPTNNKLAPSLRLFRASPQSASTNKTNLTSPHSLCTVKTTESNKSMSTVKTTASSVKSRKILVEVVKKSDVPTENKTNSHPFARATPPMTPPRPHQSLNIDTQQALTIDRITRSGGPGTPSPMSIAIKAVAKFSSTAAKQDEDKENTRRKPCNLYIKTDNLSTPMTSPHMPLSPMYCYTPNSLAPKTLLHRDIPVTGSILASPKVAITPRRGIKRV